MTHENPELMDVAAKAVLDQLVQQEKAKKPAREDTKMINKRDGDKTYGHADRRRRKLMTMAKRNRFTRVDPAPLSCSCGRPRPMGQSLPRVCSR